ncbi:MAG TPA: hypothetical protein VN969_22835 [Streptosporangiaceae bacterium]|nr:hypothetical protein [Streptosporangiaceae bacterium]
MLSAEAVTSSPASLFWVTVGLLALTIVLVALGIFTLRSPISRKKLLLTITSRSQLLSAPAAMRDDLQITYRDDPISGDPYVTAVELANVGKSHINSNEFDGSRPLKFALDTRIIKLLSTEHTPSQAPSPVITAEGTAFSLNPELIAKGEVIKVALLTEGRPQRIVTEFAPFGGVDIEIGDRELLESKRARQLRVAVVAGSALLLALIGGEFVLLTNALHQSFGTANSAVSTANNALSAGTCLDLKDEALNVFGLIESLQVEAGTIQSNSHDQSNFIRSYDVIATLAQGDLSFINGDYESLSADGISLGPSAKMISLTRQAGKAMGEAAKLSSGQAIANFSNHVASTETGLISPSLIPDACESAKVST